MVNITVYFEGGTLGQDGQTMNNTPALRQSLNQLFSKALQRDVEITLGAGYRNTASSFLKNSDKSCGSTCLYVDLDDSKEKRSNWFLKLEKENPKNPLYIPEDKKPNVFFMIQEMEAWFLKQPEAIEQWGEAQGYIRKQPEPLKNHASIKDKDIETIKHPSKVLSTIIQQTYRKEKNGKQSKVKYGKLKSSPYIMEYINPEQLCKVDSEFQRFCDTFSSP